MSLDLNTILRDWPHENGNVKVRKIAGLDGREKLQLRVDLGVLQMEMTGRPDGQRPHNCDSLLEYHQRRAARAEEKGEGYELTPEQCAELQQEGIQYYHRYLSLFQINDFGGVMRDTQRNLDLFTFVAEHTDREELSWSMQQFRPYVLMMNTRARASILLGEGKFAEAMGEIERGRDAISEFFQRSNFPELVSKSSEIAFLDEWLEEVKAKRPLSKLEIMQREMEAAIAKELYERAAELRDIRRSYGWILDRFTALGVAVEGGSDLVAGGRKVGGSAQQRKRDHLLHHGTLLYAFDLALIPRYLHEPPRQPDYRQARAVAKVLGMRPLVAHCHLGLGEVLARAGSLEDARAELGEASQLFRSMEMRMGLARADAGLAAVSTT